MGNETVGGPDLRDLIEDGRFARKRAVDRLCALGRELDGDGFDEARWRGLLEREGLSAIESHLRDFEVRFMARHPDPVHHGGAETTEGYTPVDCPFCGEGDFDLVGLQGHLLRGWCEKYGEVSPQSHEDTKGEEADHG